MHHAIEQGVYYIAKLLIGEILKTGQTGIFEIKDGREKLPLDYAFLKVSNNSMPEENNKIIRLLMVTMKDEEQRRDSGRSSDVTDTPPSRSYNIDNIDFLTNSTLENTLPKEEVNGEDK